MSKLYAITVFFNPCNFKSLLNNYYIFRDKLDKRVELMTVELSFNGEFQIEGDNVHRLTSNSIMWQKERLINYAISHLPEDAEFFAWLDCDIIFLQDNWLDLAFKELEVSDIIQPFKKVYFGTKGETEFTPFFKFQQSVLWQYKIHKNWLERRRKKELGFASPGFAYIAKTSIFKDIGLYDRCITGSGDSALVDCLLNSDGVHGHLSYFTPKMFESLNEYKQKLVDKQPKVGYIPIEIFHMYHGTVANRNYLPRHEILRDNDYDPYNDIIIKDNVFEWNNNKQDMHERIKQYFFDRKEDL